MLASMMVLPREGHLGQVFHIFGHPKHEHNAEMVFDPTVPDVKDEDFPKHDWSHTPCSLKKESIPEHHPKPRVLDFIC